MMIPGALEPRRSVTAVNVVGAVGAVDVVDTRPADGRGGNGSELDTERPELPSWLKVSIFAATLLAAMWLSMAVF